MRAMSFVQRYGTALADFIFQAPCPLCDRPAAATLCPACQRQLRAHRYDCRQQFWQGDLPVFPWGRYDGELRQAIAALKYDHRPRVAELLGCWLAQDWRVSAQPAALQRRMSGRSLVVVPIPMHTEKRRQRGYDQAVLLAQAFCRSACLPLQARGLVRQRATVPQFGLSQAERQANLTGAFAIGQGLVSTRHAVLLLDDIYTTGATARSAVIALNQRALPVVGIVAIAAADIR
ncbi:MAG: ComF family protein [Cyanobacteria bacterium P01_A01_bin.135]